MQTDTLKLLTNAKTEIIFKNSVKIYFKKLYPN